MQMAKSPVTAINEQLANLLLKGSAHVTFSEAVEGLSLEDAGAGLNKIPYTIWQQVEHLRITQWDILEFSKSAAHKSPDFPEGYWTTHAAPADEVEWQQSLEQIARDKEEFIALLKAPDADIYKPFAHGTGQSLLREALVIADHNSYHTGQIVLMRKLMGNWRE